MTPENSAFIVNTDTRRSAADFFLYSFRVIEIEMTFAAVKPASVPESLAPVLSRGKLARRNSSNFQHSFTANFESRIFPKTSESELKRKHLKSC